MSFAKSPTHAHFTVFRVYFIFDALQYQMAIFSRPIIGP